MFITSLLWRHNGRDGVSNHQPHDCLLNRSFRRRSKKTSELRVTGLCAGNSPVTGELPAQMASNAENVSIWWRHHVFVFAGNIIVHLANTSGAFILHQAMQRRGILQGPLLLTWINFNPIMPTKMWDTVIYPFPNFNGATVEVWDSISNFIPHFIMDIITYSCWESIHVSKRAPGREVERVLIVCLQIILVPQWFSCENLGTIFWVISVISYQCSQGHLGVFLYPICIHPSALFPMRLNTELRRGLKGLLRTNSWYSGNRGEMHCPRATNQRHAIWLQHDHQSLKRWNEKLVMLTKCSSETDVSVTNFLPNLHMKSFW